MTRDYRFTYLSCQACTQRVHCDQCQTQITEMLMRLRGVQSVEINIVMKTMRVAFEGIRPDEIEEVLENAGIFVD